MMCNHAQHLVSTICLHGPKVVLDHVDDALCGSELKGGFTFDLANSEELRFTDGVPVVGLNRVFALVLEN